MLKIVFLIIILRESYSLNAFYDQNMKKKEIIMVENKTKNFKSINDFDFLDEIELPNKNQNGFSFWLKVSDLDELSWITFMLKKNISYYFESFDEKEELINFGNRTTEMVYMDDLSILALSSMTLIFDFGSSLLQK